MKLWDDIKDLIETTSESKKGKYKKDFMKIKFHSDDSLPLNQKLKLHMLTVVVRSVFEEVVKYHPQSFLDECLYEVQILQYDWIVISEGIDINKTNASKEYNICRHWYYLDKHFKNEPYLRNVCHDLMQKAINFNDFTIVSVRRSDYRIYFWYNSKSDAIDIKKNLKQIIRIFYYI